MIARVLRSQEDLRSHDIVLELRNTVVTNGKGCEKCSRNAYYEMFVIDDKDCYDQEIHKWKQLNCIKCFTRFVEEEMNANKFEDRNTWPIHDFKYDTTTKTLYTTTMEWNGLGYIGYENSITPELISTELVNIYDLWVQKLS